MADAEFVLPHEVLDQVGVPAHARYQVAYQALAAKYVALVEAVVAKTGEPIEFSLERAQEILDQDPLKTDPAVCVMVAERKPHGEGSPIVSVGIASVDEVRAANRRYALSRMGSRRN